jgi:hypothetical protein
MLFLLFGSSGAGKTVTLAALRGRVPALAVHDHDEIGVPTGADTAWRQEANEEWVGRALAYQEEGVDLLLAAQTPLGELLAAPSAPRLNAISACLLDCDDDVRLARLRARGQAWADSAGVDLDVFNDWAVWLRHHAADPSWHPNALTWADPDRHQHWGRWDTWKAGDPRWQVRVIDTSHDSVAGVAENIVSWVEEERALYAKGDHELATWAQDVRER